MKDRLISLRSFDTKKRICYFARKKTAQFLDMMGQGAAEYSEATAELIDDEVREIINTQYARALDILREKK